VSFNYSRLSGGCMRGKSVDILGKTYNIKFLKDTKFEEDEFGEVDFDKMEISINVEKGTDHQRDTVVHEILHAIDYDMKLNLSEKQVRSLACAVYQVLKSNIKLRRWLFRSGNSKSKIGF
jgi:hypothetical protein